MNGEMQRRAQTVSRETYEIGDAIPVDGLDAVPAGTNLLIEGPPMTGKRQIAVAILARGIERGENAVVITPDDSGERLRSRHDVLDDDDRVHFVDCSGASGKGSFDDTGRIKHVSSPGDLTGIGIAMAKCTRTIGEEAESGLRIAVLSLSTMLQYASAEKMFSFVHVITGRVAAAGYLSVATIDPTIHDDATVNAIKAQYDGVLELRDADTGTEHRLRGLSGARSE